MSWKYWPLFWSWLSGAWSVTTTLAVATGSYWMGVTGVGLAILTLVVAAKELHPKKRDIKSFRFKARR